MSRLNRLIEAVRGPSPIDNDMLIYKSAYERAFLKNIDIGEDYQGVLSEPYSKSDLVYVCISTTGKAISQVPIIFVDKDNEPVEGPLADSLRGLIESPNVYMDQYSFFEAIVSYLLLEGNSYVIPYPNISSPDFLYVFSRNHVTPMRGKENNALQGWKYNPSGTGSVDTVNTQIFGVEDICPIWFWNPSDPIIGMPPLEAGRIPIASDYVASKYNMAFLKNSAAPGGVLSTEQKLGKPQYERLKGEITQQHGGTDNQGKLLLLDSGLKYSQRTLSQRDMEFKDLRGLNAERIIQIFGMKKSIISITNDLNRATAEAERKEWWLSTNIPIMKLVASALNSSIFFRFGVRMIFDLASIEALGTTFKDKVIVAKKLSELGFTTNEINKKLELGFEEADWRNKWWGSGNTVALSHLEDEPVKPDEPNEPDDDIEEETFLINSVVTITDPQEIYKSISPKLLTIEKKFEKKLKGIFYKMRTKSLEILHGVKSIKSPNELSLEAFTAEMEELQIATSGLYASSMQVGINSLATEIGMGIAFDLEDPVAVEYLARKKMKITRVSTTIKRQLNFQLSEGSRGGESITQLAQRVKEVFNASRSRAVMIARTEVIGASNYSRFEGINRSRFKKKQWLTANDSKVRSGPVNNHAIMNGKTVDVGEYWNTPGGMLRYPGDYMGAAGNIIMCRCIEIIVASSFE